MIRSIPKNIDYSIIEKAKIFYAQKGYKYIEVPWVVSSDAINITMPKSIPWQHKTLLLLLGNSLFFR